MILIKENVEKIVDDSSQGVINQLLLKGWTKLPDPKSKKKKTESKKAESKEPEVNADAQTV
ncbi:MAG: hypothetical protein Q4P27_02725 [Eubacteriales bacterium]|nr:hypothetical protein [Eubacteriales bacterium]